MPVTDSTPARILIVNADDFGLTVGINRGIAYAHEHGIVSSASLMTRAPAARDAADLARRFPRLGVGLHVDLGEWKFHNDSWRPVYEVVPLDDPEDVAQEVERQFDSFIRLLNRPPTHLDSHQHVHRHEPVLSVLRTWSRKLSIPLRHYAPMVHYCGDFYAQTGTGDPSPEAVTVPALIRLFSALAPGITELGCHPGEIEGLASAYCSERGIELASLCDPATKAALVTNGIVLKSFVDIPATSHDG